MEHLLSVEYTDAEKKGEEQFVFLKERPTDISVDTAREVTVEMFNPRLQYVRLLTVLYRLKIKQINILEVCHSYCSLQAEDKTDKYEQINIYEGLPAMTN